MFGASKDTLKSMIRREKIARSLPPKLKTSKSSIKGRLGLLTKQIVDINPKLSYRAIPGAVKDAVGSHVAVPSYKAFENFLKANGYIHKKLEKKPMISGINKQKRIEFSKKFIEKDIGFWGKVLWSDETMVRSIPTKMEMFHKVHKSVKKHDLPVNPQIQNGGFGVMFWGCFSRAGVGPLVVIDGIMNRESYLNLLKNTILPKIRLANNIDFFMQDNAPCHTARLVKDFLAQENVPVLPWPAQSPDLNPIENLWALIKRKLASEFSTPKTRSELIANVETIWNGISPELCQNLSDSMTNRLKEVLQNKGNSTSY